MKKILLVTILVFVCSCTKKDEAYYSANKEARDAKLKECETEMIAAQISQDGDRAKAVMTDEECNSANKVKMKAFFGVK